MTYDQFEMSLTLKQPPAGLSSLLRALWHDRQGDWTTAHEITQDVESADGAQVHGYLHRKEGDPWNAGYWYRRAGVTPPECSLEEEWHRLVNKLLPQ